MPAKKVKRAAKKAVKKTKKAAKKVSRKVTKTMTKTKAMIVGQTSHIMPVGKKVGRVVHYYPKINVAVVNVTGHLKKGDSIVIRGRSTMFKQHVESMQMEHESIPEAKAGQSIGMKVNGRVHEGDEVYLAA